MGDDKFAKKLIHTTESGQGDSWTGLYLGGYSTNIEILSPSGWVGSLGNTGLAIGLNRVGDTAQLNNRFQQLTGNEASLFTRTRMMGDQQIDWFEAAMPSAVTSDTPPPFVLWSMEYYPSYFEADTTKVAGQGPDDISDVRYYANHYDENKLLCDIEKLIFDITQEQKESVASFLSAAGYEVVTANSQIVARQGEEEIVFNLTDTNGLREMVFSLNQEMEEPIVEHLGNSALTVGPGTQGNWTFS